MRWSVNATVTGGKHIGVFEAATGEEALAMAGERAHVSLCHQCSEQCDDAQIESMTAQCGDVVVTDEETWQDRARAAGWKPPRAKKAKKGT